MNRKLIIILTVITSILAGCKDDKPVDDLKVVESKAESKIFTCTLDVVAKVEDDFALLYTEDGTINFYTIPAIWQHFKGSPDTQQVVFTLPADAMPTQIRVDLGLKQNQENIVLQGFKLAYGSKTFEAKGAEVWKYFRPDENQCKVNMGTNEIIANVDGNKRKTPSLYPIETEMATAIAGVLK